MHSATNGPAAKMTVYCGATLFPSPTNTMVRLCGIGLRGRSGPDTRPLSTRPPDTSRMASSSSRSLSSTASNRSLAAPASVICAVEQSTLDGGLDFGTSAIRPVPFTSFERRLEALRGGSITSLAFMICSSHDQGSALPSGTSRASTASSAAPVSTTGGKCAVSSGTK